MGYHFSVLWGAVAHLQDGTSASTPTVAAIIALVNDALIDAGRPPLGFLNPWLYSVGASAFRDVKVGSNMGCNTSGFPATEGWDPATGLGTPVSRHGLFIYICAETNTLHGSGSRNSRKRRWHRGFELLDLGIICQVYDGYLVKWDFCSSCVLFIGIL